MDSINFARLQELGNALTPKAGEASLEEIQEQRRQDEAAEEARQARNKQFLTRFDPVFIDRSCLKMLRPTRSWCTTATLT